MEGAWKKIVSRLRKFDGEYIVLDTRNDLAIIVHNRKVMKSDIGTVIKKFFNVDIADDRFFELDEVEAEKFLLGDWHDRKNRSRKR